MAELTQRARAVAVVLSARVPEASRQPVPYTLTDVNAIRDWLNQSDVVQPEASDEAAVDGLGRMISPQASLRSEQQIVDAFYRMANQPGYRFRSSWNPAIEQMPGVPRVTDPAIMTPVGGPVRRQNQQRPSRGAPVVDLTDDHSPTSPVQPSAPGNRANEANTARSSTGSQPSPSSSRAGRPVPPPIFTGQPATVAPRHHSPVVIVTPTGRPPRRPLASTASPVTPSPAPRPPPASTAPPTSTAPPAASSPTLGPQPFLCGYAKPADVPLTVLFARAADPTGHRVVIGLVRPAGDDASLRSRLVATAGSDSAGRINFRIAGRTLDGSRSTGAGRGNSASWDSLLDRGLVLLGRFTGANGERDIRDFLVQHEGTLSQAVAAGPSTSTNPATPTRPSALPLSNHSPTDQKTGRPKTRIAAINRRDSPEGEPSPVNRRMGAIYEDDEEEMARVMAESYRWRGGHLRGG